jgi:hypothetical protein
VDVRETRVIKSVKITEAAVIGKFWSLWMPFAEAETALPEKYKGVCVVGAINR